MKTPSGAELVGLIAAIVAGACIVAVVVLAIREKRRTGTYPRCVTGAMNETGWFGFTWIMWIVGRGYIPESWLNLLPVSVLVLGIDLALLVAFAAYGAYALAHVFRSDWSRSWALWIAKSLVFPAISAAFLVLDAKRAAHAPWLWIPAGLIAIILAPFFARFAFEDFYLRRLHADRTPGRTDG